MSGSLGRHKYILATIPILLFAVGATVYEVFPKPSNQGYAPEQPIPFSHKRHAMDNKIACQYCHTGADKSRHATIPAMNVCMNCHQVVKTDSPWIQKLKKHYDEGKPIEWIRIHELPDFVFFSHKPHVNRGITCETCHGDIKTMARIEQSKPLTMGWCLECHKGRTTPKHILKETYPDTENPSGPVAPTNCSTCHY